MTYEMAYKIVKLDSPELIAHRLVELYDVIDQLSTKLEDKKTIETRKTILFPPRIPAASSWRPRP